MNFFSFSIDFYNDNNLSFYDLFRVEFRSIEAQLTEFENAAFAVFIILLSRALSDSDLNLYIPLSKVDENMRRAHDRDAVLKQNFYFRQYVTNGNCKNLLDLHFCYFSQCSSIL